MTVKENDRDWRELQLIRGETYKTKSWCYVEQL